MIYDMKKKITKKFDLKIWQLSNCSILLAIMLLIVMAIAMSIGYEHDAEYLVAYAYYLFIIGIVTRLFGELRNENRN